MNDTLKGVAQIGAELAAAKAEVQLEMERHRKTWRQLDSLRDVAREALAVIERLRPETHGVGTIVRLKAALSQQAEPVEQAPAQDEREPEMFAVRYLSHWDEEGDDVYVLAWKYEGELVTHEGGVKISDLLEYEGDKVLNVWPLSTARPAQTEQQPVGEMISNDGDIYWTDRHPPMGTKLYAAPIAQTAPQPVLPVDSEAWLQEWARGKFTYTGAYKPRVLGQLYGNTDWALARALHNAIVSQTAAPIAQTAPQQGVQLADTRRSRIYLAGPMTGIADYNFSAFNAEADRLRGQGYHVENPADHGVVEGGDWADYLRYDIGRLATCECIHLLPGWSQSSGAKLEVSIAKALGMHILYAEGAETTSQPEQSETVLVPVSVIEEAAHMLEAHSPGSGSVESFVAQDLRAALTAQGPKP